MTWFENWFDSKYYHILYRNRDNKEANLFIENILKIIKPDNNCHFLDLGCGSGRHAINLNKKGFYLDGIDLSEKSLQKAIPYENDKLKFHHMDMRNINFKNQYDVILNLFTSFGYFNNDKEHQLVFRNIYNALKVNGYFIIDFFNASKIVNNQKNNLFETKVINNILFEIEKKHDSEFVYKKIKITDGNKKFLFNEKVKLITKKKFLNYFRNLNISLKFEYGDYHLNKYNLNSSDRLILIFQKNA